MFYRYLLTLFLSLYDLYRIALLRFFCLTYYFKKIDICFILVWYSMDCIFCKLIAKELPSIKIWENDQFIALFDAFPACNGQTLILPKKHYDSDIFMMNTDVYTTFMLATHEVVALLKAWLWVEKIGMVVEWLQVPHAHIKLYPFRWGKSFVWWLTGHTMADMNELQKLADTIRDNI